MFQKRLQWTFPRRSGNLPCEGPWGEWEQTLPLKVTQISQLKQRNILIVSGKEDMRN